MPDQQKSQGIRGTFDTAKNFIKKHPIMILGVIAGLAAAAAFSAGTALIPAMFLISAKLGLWSSIPVVLTATYLMHKSNALKSVPVFFSHFIIAGGLIAFSGIIPVVGVAMTAAAAGLAVSMLPKVLTECVKSFVACVKDCFTKKEKPQQINEDKNSKLQKGTVASISNTIPVSGFDAKQNNNDGKLAARKEEKQNVYPVLTQPNPNPSLKR